MIAGMLWLDADKNRTLEEKISRAAEYYQHKYGEPAQTCYVPTVTAPDEFEIGKLRVLPVGSVNLHHLILTSVAN